MTEVVTAYDPILLDAARRVLRTRLGRKRLESLHPDLAAAASEHKAKATRAEWSPTKCSVPTGQGAPSLPHAPRQSRKLNGEELFIDAGGILGTGNDFYRAQVFPDLYPKQKPMLLRNWSADEQQMFGMVYDDRPDWKIRRTLTTTNVGTDWQPWIPTDDRQENDHAEVSFKSDDPYDKPLKALAPHEEPEVKDIYGRDWASDWEKLFGEPEKNHRARRRHPTSAMTMADGSPLRRLSVWVVEVGEPRDGLRDGKASTVLAGRHRELDVDGDPLGSRFMDQFVYPDSPKAIVDGGHGFLVEAFESQSPIMSICRYSPDDDPHPVRRISVSGFSCEFGGIDACKCNGCILEAMDLVGQIRKVGRPPVHCGATECKRAYDAERKSNKRAGLPPPGESAMAELRGHREKLPRDSRGWYIQDNPFDLDSITSGPWRFNVSPEWWNRFSPRSPFRPKRTDREVTASYLRVSGLFPKVGEPAKKAEQTGDLATAC